MEERKTKQQDQMESLVRHFYEIPGKVVMLHDGEYLFHEGDMARYFYIVRSGQIFITKYAMSGRVLSLRLASRGSLIGELPLYEKDPVYIFNAVAQVYVTVIRGTPMMVQLLIMSMVIFASSRNYTMIGILALGINSGAYVSEIVRSGLMSVDPGQMEAGRSLGLNYFTTMRFIVIPQAVKNILPALGNEFITLLKDTSLITVIGGKEMTYAAKAVIAKTYQGLFPLFGIALMYLLLVMLFSKLLGVLERRLRQSDRR